MSLPNTFVANMSSTLPPEMVTLRDGFTHMEIPLVERVIEALILTCISIVALVGNTCLWIIICRDKNLQSSSNALILGLSMADLLVSGVNMPLAVASIIAGQWLLSRTACVVFGFITMLTFVASVMSLGAISLNRYFLICHPIHFKHLYTKSRTAVIILCIWLLSVVLAFPPLVGWGKYDYLPNQSFCFCDWKTSQTYTIFMVAMCFGGPCSVMTFSYVSILRKVRASRKRVGAKSNSKSTYQQETPAANPSASNEVMKVEDITSGDEVNSNNIKFQIPNDGKSKGNNNPFRKLSLKKKKKGVDESPVSEIGPSKPLTSGVAMGVGLSPVQTREKALRKGRREDMRFTTTLFVVVAIFTVCWFPFCITMFLNVFSSPVPRIPDIATLLLGCFNSSCNPIIYGVMNRRFRNGYRRLFCYICMRMKRGAVDDYTQTARQYWRNNLQ